MTAETSTRIPAELESLGVPIDAVRLHERNPRRGDVDLIRESLRAHGQYLPLLVRRETGEVLVHNHVLQAAREEGWERVAVVYRSVPDDDEAARIALVDNRTSDRGSYDRELLDEILRELDSSDAGLLGTGYEPTDLDGILGGLGDELGSDNGAAVPRPDTPTLADRFVVPPFSVLDARGGAWQERKRRWLAVGIRSEVGRGAGYFVAGYGSVRGRFDDKGELLRSSSGRDPSYYGQKREVEARLGHELTTAEFEAEHYENRQEGGGLSETGTSVFDPVLCELAYRWFSPQAGRVLDPFAGGSVRGVVASHLGREYVGVELREEQVLANREQVGLARDPQPTWKEGDALDVVPTLEDDFDLLFTCPPYFDLETYDGGERDLSTMDGDDFAAAYREIIESSLERLRPDRFAVFVVGDVRDRAGLYRNLPGLTVSAFESAGARLYNEAILVTSLGSLPVRAGRAFEAGRKLGKTHQNVLVFVKGDPRRAVEAIGPLSPFDLPEEPDQPADD